MCREVAAAVQMFPQKQLPKGGLQKSCRENLTNITGVPNKTTKIFKVADSRKTSE